MSQYTEAEEYLKSSDKKLKAVIEKVGSCTLRVQRRNKFNVLASSIIGQQLSVKAANTIRGRVLELTSNNRTLQPDDFSMTTIKQLRSCGLSYAKSSSILELSDNIISGKLNLNTINKLSDNEVINILASQKGIGKWTAEMFMIFSLGRSNILSVTDAGLLRSAQSIYNLQNKPTPEVFKNIATKWNPYCSIASWYLWRHIDNKKPINKDP